MRHEGDATDRALAVEEEAGPPERAVPAQALQDQVGGRVEE